MERRSLRLVRLALAQVLLAVPAALVAQRSRTVDLVIASTTDVHGRVRGWDYYADTAEGGRGLSRAATIVDSVRSANPGRVLLVDAGDLLQGNPFTYVARDQKSGAHPVIAAMNAMRYDAVAVGNHEFNYGVPAFERAAAQARFPFLAANARSTDGKKRWGSFTIADRAGVKIGIIGATNPGSLIWDAENLRGKVAIDDILPAVRRTVAEARAAGAQVIVIVAHAGLDGVASYDTVTTGLGSENPMANVARQVPGIDLIVYGHSHRELADTTINGVLLTQPRNWATSVSVAHLSLKIDGAKVAVTGHRADLVRATGHREQPVVAAAADAGHTSARAYATTVIGTTATDWRADSARVADTPIMDFVLEVMRKASGAQLASAAAFSLEARLPKGNITVAQLAQLYPYDNTLKVLRINGRQLREYLEQSAKYWKVADGKVTPEPTIPSFNFEMIAGADYAMDLSKPIGARITGLSVKGVPVKESDSFTIALSNYRAGGAGGYGMLNGAPMEQDKQLEIRQLLIEEVTRKKVLLPSDYFTKNWALTPTSLQASAAAASINERPFDAIRPTNKTP
jgi:2',3'-cyclic-nucleotide 2'-phosphodiesterase (5'-nucleotidase family)